MLLKNKIIDEFGFDPNILTDCVSWGVIDTLTQEHHEAGAQIGDLYILTDCFAVATVVKDMTTLGDYIGWSVCINNPKLSYYFYQSKHNKKQRSAP